jgi:hypothetical protein
LTVTLVLKGVERGQKRSEGEGNKSFVDSPAL